MINSILFKWVGPYHVFNKALISYVVLCNYNYCVSSEYYKGTYSNSATIYVFHRIICQNKINGRRVLLKWRIFCPHYVPTKVSSVFLNPVTSYTIATFMGNFSTQMEFFHKLHTLHRNLILNFTHVFHLFVVYQPRFMPIKINISHPHPKKAHKTWCGIQLRKSITSDIISLIILMLPLSIL